MKKLLTTAIIAAALLTSSHAAEKDKFQFGIRMGAQISTIEGNVITPSALGVIAAMIADGNSKPLIGPAFGFIFEIPVHANFEIRPELNFGSQGRRFQDKDVVYSQWLGTVQVPILFRGQFGSDKIRGFAHAGPQFGYGTFLLDRLREGGDIKNKNSYSLEDAKLKPFDAGVAFGLGIEFPSVKGMEIEARYYLGLSDINDNPLVKETKNRSVHLTLAFKF